MLRRRLNGYAALSPGALGSAGNVPDKQFILMGASGPVYINETGTRSEVLPGPVFLTETS